MVVLLVLRLLSFLPLASSLDLPRRCGWEAVEGRGGECGGEGEGAGFSVHLFVFVFVLVFAVALGRFACDGVLSGSLDDPFFLVCLAAAPGRRSARFWASSRGGPGSSLLMPRAGSQSRVPLELCDP